MSDGTPASTQRSRWYYTGEVRDPALRRVTHLDRTAESTYGLMLREDASALFPSGASTDEGFTVTVNEAEGSRASSLIREALPSRYGEPPLPGKLRDFFHDTADLVLAYGTAHYELAYLDRNIAGPAEESQPFRLVLIPPGTVHKRRYRLFQYVSSNAARQHTRDGIGIIDLDPAAIVEFRLDPPLARKVRHAMQVLAAASAQTPAQSRLVNDSMRGVLQYDLSDHRRRADLIVFRATAPLGWNGRGLIDSDLLYPYLVWRQLQFLAFKIRMRDAILLQLNAAIATAGRRLGFTAAIEIGGVPTLDDVRAREEDLTHGRQTLTAIYRWAMQ